MKKFSEWLKVREDTTAACVSGGGTSSGDVAQFARPVIGGPVRRMWPAIDEKKKKKDKFGF